jgi:ABC-type lipoprotein export system ATPase subunit
MTNPIGQELSRALGRVTLLGGRDRTGRPEAVSRLDLQMGNVVSIVGPTGSGKTTLINDLELFADGNTPSGRHVLIDGQRPRPEWRDDPASHTIALITQHTKFLSDLPVGEFLTLHASVRRPGDADELVGATLAFANELTGEPIERHVRMTELSGGQTRALLIADATVVCSTPIILLDEIENAGIHRARALQLLRRHRKIFLFVTHDPHIVLLSDFRVIMRGGGMTSVLQTSVEEQQVSAAVGRLDDLQSRLRERLRLGERLVSADAAALEAAL